MIELLAVGLPSLILCLATALAFGRTPHGFFRGLAFPRLQILALALAFLPLALWLLHGPVRWTLAAGLVAVIVVQAVFIARFSPLVRKQSALYRGDPNGANTVSVLSANIKQSNRRYADALALARSSDADLSLFMETDAAWVDALKPLREHWPHAVLQPMPNAYGMALFSKLPLSDVVVRDLVMEGVPSIAVTVRLRNGERFRLHCVHPEPPVPHIDSLGRDGELLAIARLVTTEPLPAVVAGDLNDVAWSHTTRLFQRMSRLLDPRVGRGFFNTFDARYPFLRWPLDHLFHDPLFHLVAMRRLPAGGSDHFPMFFKLALTGDAQASELPDAPDAADRSEAAEIAEGARELDREAIGVNWES